MQIALIAPDAPAGSDDAVYARRLAMALQALGHAAELFDGASPVPPGAGVIRCALIHSPAAQPPSDADVVVASSAAVADALGLPRESVLAPGSDPAMRVPFAGAPTCRILSVTRPGDGARMEVLSRALARLGDLDWTLTLCGTPIEDPPPAIAARLRFLGADAPPPWEEADLFALATGPGGLHLAVLDALRRGLPVGVAGGGAGGAAVPVEAGMVCAVDDGDLLSKGLRRVIFDTGLRAQMADAAWQAGQALPDWTEQATALAARLETGG
jgi:hypothetical protein